MMGGTDFNGKTSNMVIGKFNVWSSLSTKTVQTSCDKQTCSTWYLYLYSSTIMKYVYLGSQYLYLYSYLRVGTHTCTCTWDLSTTCHMPCVLGMNGYPIQPPGCGRFSTIRWNLALARLHVQACRIRFSQITVPHPSLNVMSLRSYELVSAAKICRWSLWSL